MKVVDTKGLLCPAPLIATKRALKETDEGETLTVITDNQISFNNLTRFLNDNNTFFQVTEAEGIWTLSITKSSGNVPMTNAEEYCTPSIAHFEKGNFIVAFTSDKMGDGDDELGKLLISNFIKALKDLNKLPESMVFYNKGVKLVSKDFEDIDHIRDLETMGVNILICATCVNYYKLEGKTGAGILSNMYSIAEVMASAGNIIKP